MGKSDCDIDIVLEKLRNAKSLIFAIGLSLYGLRQEYGLEMEHVQSIEHLVSESIREIDEVSRIITTPVKEDKSETI